MKSIVIASGNENKIEEFRAMFKPLGIEVLGMKECGELEEVQETGATLAENAVIKTENLMHKLPQQEITEDSG